MASELWSAVDGFFDQALGGDDAALTHALELSARAGLPTIQVAPNQGRLLGLLARAIGARRMLEVGTLGGYSAIHLARALPPGGRLISLELEARHAAVARDAIAHAGLSQRVEVRVGRALDTLPLLAKEGAGPFDLVFIDADKPSNPDYMAWALRLTRPGGLIIVDNVVRGGAVADATSRDDNVLGVRRLAEFLSTQAQVLATAVQTVGVKGHDGLLFALVQGSARAREGLAISTPAWMARTWKRWRTHSRAGAGTPISRACSLSRSLDSVRSCFCAARRRDRRLPDHLVGLGASAPWPTAPRDPRFRCSPRAPGIGASAPLLLEEAERIVGERCRRVIGIGVGLHPGYGRARSGCTSGAVLPPRWPRRDLARPGGAEGAAIANDNDLELRFIKSLR